MKILLTNDDGYDADGLMQFYRQLEYQFECFVVAPDRGRSCCGHAVTTHLPLEVKSVSNKVWTVSGTPADCVRIGLIQLELQPDLVISGLNQGGNLGVDILYSGTVAGAREASLLGVHSIAISQYMRRDVRRDWTVNAERAIRVISQILKLPNESNGFWNVNLPALSIDDNSEFPITRCLPEIKPFHF